MVEQINRIELERVNESNVSNLTDWIHDNWFSLDDIQYLTGESKLEIPFHREFYEDRKVVEEGILTTVEAPVYKCFLLISFVESLALNDTEQVGDYDFVDIEFDQDLMRIRINTGIPIEISVHITKVDIRIYREEFASEFRSHRVLFA